MGTENGATRRGEIGEPPRLANEDSRDADAESAGDQPGDPEEHVPEEAGYGFGV